MACIGLLKRCGLLASLLFASFRFCYIAMYIIQYYTLRKCCGISLSVVHADHVDVVDPRNMLLRAVGSPACQDVLGCFSNGKTDTQPKQQNNIDKKHLEDSLFDLVDLSAVVFSWLQMPSAMRPKPSWQWPPPFMTPTF